MNNARTRIKLALTCRGSVRVVRIGRFAIDFRKGSAVRFGLPARVGMNDDIGHRELAQNAFLGSYNRLMGCYQGYNSRGGAQGVGAATTAAVVAASILILASDYVLTEMFFAR